MALSFFNEAGFFNPDVTVKKLIDMAELLALQ